MKRGLRILLALLAVALFFSFVLKVSMGARSSAFPELPNPNGYDDLVKAGSLIPSLTNAPYEMERGELSALLAANAESLRLARLGLSRTCCVPTAEMMTNFAGRVNDLADTKRLAQLLAGEGRLAEMEGRTNDAARCYLDVIRLGNEISRGGLVIHRLVGIACEAIGYAPLSKIATNLDCEQSRSLVRGLEVVDRTRVTVDEVMRNEHAFMRHEMFKSLNPVSWITGWWQARAVFKTWPQRNARVVARLRLLAAELSLRCYQSAQGRAPLGLDALVPNYLQRVPQDPYSGQPLVFRARGTNWLLYSVGPDGVDDGGKPSGKSAPGAVTKGDLFFDSPLW